jgi:hypothetical protein
MYFRYEQVLVAGLLNAFVCAFGVVQVDDLGSAAVACNSYPIVGGLRHQPTTAEMEIAESSCGISDPVDTAPAIGAVVDRLSHDLMAQSPSD